jgi:hypothetical protein
MTIAARSAIRSRHTRGRKPLHTRSAAVAMRGFGMTIVALRAAAGRLVGPSRPIRYGSGERAESRAALGPSICVVSNDKPVATNRGADALTVLNRYNIAYRHV